MRRLAGSLLYFVAALIVIYSASWMLLGLKEQAQGHTLKITHKGIFGVRIKISESPTISYTSPISSSTPSPSAKQNSTPTLTPSPTPKPTLTPTPSAEQNSILTQDVTIDSNSSILDGINNFRASKGLSRAVPNPQTCEFAKTRAGEISSAFNHDGFNQRISGNTLPYLSYSIVTENIAENSDPAQVLNMWINSAPHAENMQKDTPYICVIQNGNYFAYEGWRP